jgi:hypothetical protein
MDKGIPLLYNAFTAHLYVRYKDHEGVSRVCPFDEVDLEPVTNR